MPETSPSEIQAAMDATARAIAELFGPIFADSDPKTWNELSQDDRVVYEDGRAVGVKP